MLLLKHYQQREKEPMAGFETFSKNNSLFFDTHIEKVYGVLMSIDAD